MKILVLSDIHANLTAFEAVLNDSEGEWDRIWCLGDIVGYGPDPDECIETLRQFDHLALSGNHDWAVLDRLDIFSFNSEAQAAISWTQQSISPQNLVYLENLPSMTVESPFTLAHGSPRQPVWEYILDGWMAAANFKEFKTRFCFVGHTHVPVVFEEVGNREIGWHGPIYGQEIELNGGRFIINPGSVGQPRDYDPRASYGLLDLEELTWEFRKVAYAVEETQSRMTAEGLPSRLISRLSHGA